MQSGRSLEMQLGRSIRKVIRDAIRVAASVYRVAAARLVVCWVIRGHQRPSEANRCHQYRVAAARLGACRVIRGHQSSSEAIRCHQYRVAAARLGACRVEVRVESSKARSKARSGRDRRRDRVEVRVESEQQQQQQQQHRRREERGVDRELALDRSCEQLFTVSGACKLGRRQEELDERPVLMHSRESELCPTAGKRRAERDQRERDEQRNHVQPKTARRGGGVEAQAEAREQNV